MGYLAKLDCGFKMHGREYYEKKRMNIFETVNFQTERIVGDMIYCRKCHEPKVADFPDRNFIVKCKCSCEIERFERIQNQKTKNVRMRTSEVCQGDFNPFDD